MPFYDAKRDTRCDSSQSVPDRPDARELNAPTTIPRVDTAPPMYKGPHTGPLPRTMPNARPGTGDEIGRTQSTDNRPARRLTNPKGNANQRNGHANIVDETRFGRADQPGRALEQIRDATVSKSQTFFHS